MADHVEFESRMSDADALMWTIEKDPLLRSPPSSRSWSSTAPSTRTGCVGAWTGSAGSIPRLRQRVQGHPFSVAPPRWDVDPNFDLDYHLRFAWVGSPPTAGGGSEPGRPGRPGTVREVLDMAEPIAMQGFDRARPLWEFTLVEGLADDRCGPHHQDPPLHHRRRRRDEADDGAARPRPPGRRRHRATRRAPGRAPRRGRPNGRRRGLREPAPAGQPGPAGQLGPGPGGSADQPTRWASAPSCSPPPDRWCGWSARPPHRSARS